MNSTNTINTINSINTKYFLITIDVEDWFQVENFKPWIPFSTWDQRELRVEKNTHRLLDLFDSIKLETNQTINSINSINPTNSIDSINSINSKNPTNSINSTNSEEPSSFPACPVKFRQNSEADLTGASKPQASSFKLPGLQASQPRAERRPKATFFVLGWIAEKLPHLVREIHNRGHEVASHGCNHQLPAQLSADELKHDLTDSKKLLEDITGAEVVGYRAPSFSINDDILKTLQYCGYLYDSSYNSFGMHGRYGKISLNGAVRKGIAHRINDDFHELPVSNLQLGGLTFPLGGGAYFRLLPASIFSLGVRNILKKHNAYLFYMHPWEIDSNQPRVEESSSGFKFRHYVNLDKTAKKLAKLVDSLSHCNFITCSQYISIRDLS